MCVLLWVLAGCEPAPDPTAIPPLEDGFVLLRTFSNESNSTIDRINLDVVGLAVEGDRIAVLTFFGTTLDDFTGRAPPTLNAQTLVVSEDGGRTFTEHGVAPFGEADPPGRLSGLAFVAGRLVSRLHSEAYIALVELDPASGAYEKLTLTLEGRELFPHSHLYAEGDELVWATTDADVSQLLATRVSMSTLEGRAYSYFHPECRPSHYLRHQTGTWLFPVLHPSGSTAQSLCSTGTEYCWMQWSLSDASPIDSGLTAAPCASREELFGDDDPARFAVAVTRATAGGLRVIGVQDDGHAVIRGLVRSPAGSGPLRIDLGRGGVVVEDVFGIGPKLADAFAFVPTCEDFTEGNTGRCLDADQRPLVPEIRPTLMVPSDDYATAYEPLPLARPCDDPAWCPTLPRMMIRDAPGRRYYTVWLLNRTERIGFTDYGTMALVGGWVDDPRHPIAPPPGSLTGEDVTPLELRCWAEVACDPWPAGVEAPPGTTELRQQQECVQRWLPVRGAPDAAYARFLAVDPGDCAALRAADPAGEACTDGVPSCSADGAALLCGQTTWGMSTSCADANAGTCTLDAEGRPGCYADACASGPGPAHCDTSGRAVDCERGVVDDCTAHGLSCMSGAIAGTAITLAGCIDPSLSCAAPGEWRRCEGPIAYSCDYGVPLLAVDCSRAGGTCAAGGCETVSGPDDRFGCDGDVLYYPGASRARRVDCAALGMRCHEDESGAQWCGR